MCSSHRPAPYDEKTGREHVRLLRDILANPKLDDAGCCLYPYFSYIDTQNVETKQHKNGETVFPLVYDTFDCVHLYKKCVIDSILSRSKSTCGMSQELVLLWLESPSRKPQAARRSLVLGSRAPRRTKSLHHSIYNGILRK